MSDCILCKIAAKEIPAKLIYEDPEIFAFEDIHPQAPVHLLICPRKHIESLAHAQEADGAILGRMLLVAKKLAADRGHGSAHRAIFNSGAAAGQSVFHIHLHLLAGRPMSWPPG